MSLTRKIAFNTIVQVVGKVITTLISLVLVTALTRYLGVSGYGQYTTVFAYIAFFGVIADFGFFWILVREIANPKNNFDQAVNNILTLRTVLGVLVYGAAFLIGLLIPQYQDFQWGIGITALASLFLALNSTYVGVFQNKLRMDKATLTDVVGRAVILAITLYLINQNYGLNAILWAYALGNIVNFFLSAWLGRIYIRFRFAFDFVYWKKVFFQALPMGIVLMLNLVYFKVDTLMLSMMKSSTDVGIYGPPYKILEILLLFPAIFMGNVFPAMTRYIYERSEKIHNAIQKSFDFLLMAGLPLVIGVIFTAPKIIAAVAGQEFVTAQTIPSTWVVSATSAGALQILAVAVGISFISHLFGYLVIALGKQTQLIAPNVILVFINVGLNFLLIPKISYIGAALTTVLTEALVLFFSWWVANRQMTIKLNFNLTWRILLANLALGLFLYYWNNSFNLAVLILFSLVIYLVGLWIVGAINRRVFRLIFDLEGEGKR